MFYLTDRVKSRRIKLETNFYQSLEAFRIHQDELQERMLCEISRVLYRSLSSLEKNKC